MTNKPNQPNQAVQMEFANEVVLAYKKQRDTALQSQAETEAQVQILAKRIAAMVTIIRKLGIEHEFGLASPPAPAAALDPPAAQEQAEQSKAEEPKKRKPKAA